MPPLNPIPATTTLSLPVRSLDELLGLGPGLAPAPDVQHGALPHVPLHPVAAQALLNRARGVGPHGMPPRGAVQQSPAADNQPSEPMAHLTVTHQQPSLAISEAQAVRAHAVQPKPAPAPKAVALQPGPLPPPPERAPAAPHPAAGTPALPARPPMGLPMPAPGLGSAVAAGAGMAPVPAPGAGPSWMHRPLPFLDRVPVLGHITPGGFLHGLGEGLKYAGIAAGTEFAPGAMEMIPGTPQHAMVESIERQNAQREADVHQLAQTEEGLRRAQAWKDLHPQPREEPLHPYTFNGKTVLLNPDQANQFNQEYPGQLQPYAKPATAHFEHVDATVNGQEAMLDYNTATGEFTDGAGNAVPLGDIEGLHLKSTQEQALTDLVGPEPTSAQWNGRSYGSAVAAKEAWAKAFLAAAQKAKQLNFAEAWLKSRTVTFQDPGSGVPFVYQFDTKTGRYDTPVGVAATGRFASQQELGAAANRYALNTLIPLIQKNMAFIGTPQAWAQVLALGTPAANPTIAAVQQAIKSYELVLAGIHGVRGKYALEALHEALGGPGTSPAAIIAAVREGVAMSNALNPPPRGQANAGVVRRNVVRHQGRIPDGAIISNGKTSMEMKNGRWVTIGH